MAGYCRWNAYALGDARVTNWLKHHRQGRQRRLSLKSRHTISPMTSSFWSLQKETPHGEHRQRSSYAVEHRMLTLRPETTKARQSTIEQPILNSRFATSLYETMRG